MREYREITIADIGKVMFPAFGRKWSTCNFIGRILPGDVGKRVYQVGDILQVENDEQRDERINMQARHATHNAKVISEARRRYGAGPD